MNQISIILTLGCCLVAAMKTPQAWGEDGNFNSGLLSASADNPASASSEPADEAAQTAELVEKLQNPVSDLISAPIQNNWDFGIGPADAMRYTANIQPVIPFSLSKDWLVVTRTILPIIYAESPVQGGRDAWGLGDTLQSFFFSPKAGVWGCTAGAGPVLLYPSATDRALGSGQWGAGPTWVALKQQHGWTAGLLGNHVWSCTGWGDGDVSSTLLQPFVSYTTRTRTTFGVNTESSYDWEGHQWTVPLNVSVSQLLRVGKLPISVGIGGRSYLDKPSGGSDWGLRFTITFLFPK